MNQPIENKLIDGIKYWVKYAATLNCYYLNHITSVQNDKKE